VIVATAAAALARLAAGIRAPDRCTAILGGIGGGEVAVAAAGAAVEEGGAKGAEGGGEVGARGFGVGGEAGEGPQRCRARGAGGRGVGRGANLRPGGDRGRLA
jgi:hypothetical protein